MKYRYKISLDNDKFVELNKDEPIDVDGLSNERWAVIKSPSAAYYLNIAHITMIEVEVIE